VSLDDWDEVLERWKGMYDKTEVTDLLLITLEMRDKELHAARKHRFHQPIAATSSQQHTHQTRPSMACSSRKASGADSTYLPS
jgi:hypothetical protein